MGKEKENKNQEIKMRSQGRRRQDALEWRYHMKRRIMAGIIFSFAAGVVLPWGGVRAEAVDTVVYDAAGFGAFQNRTKEEVGRRYGEAMYAGESYINGDSSSYYETAYSLEDPYAAGKLTEDTHKTMTAMTEFYRWLVGVKPLQEVSVHSDKLQAEALVRNFEFNHTISDSSKPEDMTQEFWDYGAKDYIHTILARYSTPRNAIISWMNEGYNHSFGWDTVGHRYALIGAAVSDVQFGYAGSIAIGQEKAYENAMETPFSAFPAPGYMPSDLVRSSSSAWSIQINGEQITVSDRSSVMVKVTDTDTGESYECTTANGKLRASEYSSQLVFVQPVLESGKRYEGSWQVDVTGLTDVESGKEAAITYTVEFFDPTEYTPSYVKTVTADGIEKFIIYTSTATTENLKKIAYALPDEVTVIAENGRTARVPVMGKWILDEERQCWVNQADETKLPSDITDRENVLKKCAVYYEISDSTYNSYNSLTILPGEAKVGDKAQMHVFLSLISADASAIFQLTPQEDGSYIGVKKYDSRTSTGFQVTDNGDHLYTIPSLQKSDTGEYFSIFYESSGTCAYVSTQIRTLTVQDESLSGNDPQSTPVGIGGDGGTGSSGVDSKRPDTEAGQGNKATIPKVAKVSGLKGKVKAKGKRRSLDLTWKKVSGAGGYQVQISTKKSFKGAKKITVKKSKRRYKTSMLKKKKKYYVRVRAWKDYKTEKGKAKKAYGKWRMIRI